MLNVVQYARPPVTQVPAHQAVDAIRKWLRCACLLWLNVPTFDYTMRRLAATTREQGSWDENRCSKIVRDFFMIS